MKDKIMLIAAGIICALLAWAFFVYFQNSAFTIMLLVLAISVLAKPAKSKFSKKKPNE